MGIATSLFVLIFYMIYQWTDQKALESGFKRMHKGYYHLMMFAIACFCITVMTIDGKDNGPLHTPCAVFFFLALEVFTVYTTLFLTELRRWDTTIMTSKSLKIKQVLAFYITAVWIYCLYGAYGVND